jgi:hypothetical protein
MLQTLVPVLIESFGNLFWQWVYQEPLSFIELATRRDGHSAVIDVGEFLPFADWRASAPSGRDDEWSYAFGDAGSSASKPMAISRVGKSIEVGLPTTAPIRAGAVLRIEESEDLVNWTQVAILDPAISDGWLGGDSSIELDLPAQAVRMSGSSGARFFRSRLTLAK